jgi:hypothetical protein
MSLSKRAPAGIKFQYRGETYETISAECEADHFRAFDWIREIVNDPRSKPLKEVTKVAAEIMNLELCHRWPLEIGSRQHRPLQIDPYARARAIDLLQRCRYIDAECRPVLREGSRVGRLDGSDPT